MCVIPSSYPPLMKKLRDSIVSMAVAAGSMMGAVAAEKPNILFIFADDYAYDCLHAHGNARVETPNLDKLVARGTSFSQAYNSGAWDGAVCVASRRMMMTGMQIWDAQKAKLGYMVKHKKMFPNRLQRAGYTTYFSGKWHVGPEQFCRDTWENVAHVRPGMPDQTEVRYQRNFTPGEDDWDPADPKFGGFWEGGTHWSEVLAQDSEQFFDVVKEKDDPFCMMLCFNAAHDPRQAPKEYQDKYPYDSIEVPKNFLETYPYEIGSNKCRDEQLAPFPRTEHSIKVNLSEYYAIISFMDTQIGRILDALEKSGKADNTYIIFTADHGLAVGQHGLVGKQNMYEHSVRAPWIIAGPGVPAGKTVDTPIYIQDAMATCLDVAGAEMDGVAFESVLPLLNAEANEERDMYSSFISYQRTVISGKYKLIVYPHLKEELLFDLDADALEMHNLAKNPEYAAVLGKMRVKLGEQMEKMNDPLDLENPDAFYATTGLKQKAHH